jgi:hypothetical protein
MSNYFTKDTDRSIERFQDATSDQEKHLIFNEEIRPAFEKLIENLIFVYRFYSLGDVETLKRECLTDLYSTLPKFDAEKSANPDKLTSTSFSYFNMVAKNWFIAKSREASKKNKNESELFYDLDHEAVKNDPNFMIAPHEALVEDKEKWVEFYKAMDSWKGELKKKNGRQVLDAIIFLLKNSELVSIYNKKAVYLYLRELTGLNTKQIVVNLKKIRALYEEWSEDYYSGETGNESSKSVNRAAAGGDRRELEEGS